MAPIFPLKATIFTGKDGTGSPLIGVVNTSFVAFEWKRDFPWCLHVALWVDAAANSGLPTGTENEHLQAFHDDFIEILRHQMAVLDVAHISGGGKRELWWYVGAREQSVLAVEAYLASHTIGWPIDYAISRDDDWSMVMPFLGEMKSKTNAKVPIFEKIAQWWGALTNRPVPALEVLDSTERTEHEGDQAVIDQLRRAGSNLQKPTDISLYVYVPTSASAVDAQIEILSNNYRAEVVLPLTRPDDPEGSRDFSVLTQINAIPSIENISAMRSFFSDLANRHGGIYDGWEAAVVK